MIESGGRVQANERCAKNGATKDLPDSAADDCKDQKYDEADDAADEAEAVCDRVGEFVGGDVASESAGPGEHAFSLRACGSDDKSNRKKCVRHNISTH